MGFTEESNHRRDRRREALSNEQKEIEHIEEKWEERGDKHQSGKEKEIEVGDRE